MSSEIREKLLPILPRLHTRQYITDKKVYTDNISHSRRSLLFAEMYLLLNYKK